MPKKSLLLVLVACAIPVLAAEDVYKWTDADGVVHFSDTAPGRSTKAELIHLTGSAATTTETAAPSPGSAAPAAGADGVGAGAAKPTPPAEPTRTASVMNAQKRCEQARANLALLQGEGPVGIDTKGQGEPKPLDDAARQARIAGAQAMIATYCK